MKVRRKQAKPYNGEPLPFKLALAISRGEASIPKPSPAVFPVCEMVQWRGHGHVPKKSEEDAIHTRVLHWRHPDVPVEVRAVHLAEAGWRRVDPELCGICFNLAGHQCFVELGDHLVKYPSGLIHHGEHTGKDLRSYYDAVNELGEVVPLTAPEPLP